MAYTTINKPSDYFNTKLYTGNGSTNAITGVGFQPDWVWLKDRDNANSHKLYDGVRGTTKFLSSEDNSAEGTQSNGLTSFDSDGFTLGSYGGTNGSGGGSGPNFVSWNWLGANGTASNTDGSITSTVSANTTSGFSIVSYTGTGVAATVGHGLNSPPELIITKGRGSTEGWFTTGSGGLDGKFIYLNTTDAAIAHNLGKTSGEITNTTMVVAGNGENQSSIDMIAYCFHSVQGYSKFGSYTGNGNSDGTFVYTGFKPAFVMIKASSQAETNWVIVDNKREGYNPDNNRLFPDTTQVESTTDVVDLLSNGFKLRSGAGSSNGPSYTHIYMAFAEAPLVGSNDITAKAR